MIHHSLGQVLIRQEWKASLSDMGLNKFIYLIIETHTMVHHSLGQVLTRQEWKASLPDMGLNKFVRVTSAPWPIPKADNSFLGRGLSLPQCI